MVTPQPPTESLCCPALAPSPGHQGGPVPPPVTPRFLGPQGQQEWDQQQRDTAEGQHSGQGGFEPQHRWLLDLQQPQDHHVGVPFPWEFMVPPSLCVGTKSKQSILWKIIPYIHECALSHFKFLLRQSSSRGCALIRMP